MSLLPESYLLGAASLLLEVGVCAYALRRRLYLRLPWFTAYLTLLVGHTLLVWFLYLGGGYDSRLTFYCYWATQGLLLAARAAAVAEIARRALHGYCGVWALGWRLLCGVALLLLAHAAVDARGNSAWIATFLVTAERDLELAVVGVLVLLLAICRYYGIRLEPVQQMVALGMGFYSALQVFNNSVLQAWLPGYFQVWNDIRMVSFQAALVIWLLALRRPLPALAPAPALLPQEVYDELSPQLNYRLRILNQRLLEILRP
jgi:hypothetical protein